jgi:hypothetical protein
VTFADEADREGYDAVTSAPEVSSMKKVKTQLTAHTSAFSAELERINGNKDLTDEAQERRRVSVRERRNEAIARVVKSYGVSEAALLKRFSDEALPDISPSAGDTNLILIAIAQAPNLSPKEFTEKLVAITKTGNRALLQSILPIARSFALRPEYATKSTPIGEDDPLVAAIKKATAVVNGSRPHAARHAKELAAKPRRQMEIVSRTISTEGRWEGSAPSRIEPSTTPDLD